MIPQTNKQPGRYQAKQQGVEVRDVDEKSRKVSGYLSVFNVVDSDRDIILPGSFRQSLQMRGPKSSTSRKIAFLRNHSWDWQIGKFTELEEDSYGLKFVAELGRSSKGEDALKDYQDGILLEHSIGFQYTKDGIEYNEDEEVFYVSEIMLLEGSAVTFGANPFTRVLSVAAKSLEDRQSFEAELFEEGEAIARLLKNSDLTPERVYALEMRMKLHNSKTFSYLEQIKAVQPSVKTLIGQSEPAEDVRGLLLSILTDHEFSNQIT